jgi:hypothetical protein
MFWILLFWTKSTPIPRIFIIQLTIITKKYKVFHQLLFKLKFLLTYFKKQKILTKIQKCQYYQFFHFNLDLSHLAEFMPFHSSDFL